jgi:hypothetical protein
LLTALGFQPKHEDFCEHSRPPQIFTPSRATRLGQAGLKQPCDRKHISLRLWLNCLGRLAAASIACLPVSAPFSARFATGRAASACPALLRPHYRRQRGTLNDPKLRRSKGTKALLVSTIPLVCIRLSIPSQTMKISASTSPSLSIFTSFLDDDFMTV